MRNSITSTIIFIFLVLSVNAQKNKYLRKNKEPRVISYAQDNCYSRSIKIVNDRIYTANSNGALYSTSLSGDSSFNLMKGKRFQEMRDLEYVNGHLLGMQSGDYGLLAKTTLNKFDEFILPEGTFWMDVFLDAMDFRDNLGFLMGDPKNGHFSLFISKDGGNHWTECEGKIEPYEKEYAFAASGTTAQILEDGSFVFVTGGMKSRFFRSFDQGKTWKETSLPYMNAETNGPFSVHFKDSVNGVIVGGDYKNYNLDLNTSFYTDDGGEFWINAETQPRGYRSCVIEANGVYYCCGTSGIDFSIDGGRNWNPFANGNYFAMTYYNNELYATTTNGTIHIFKGVENE